MPSSSYCFNQVQLHHRQPHIRLSRCHLAKLVEYQYLRICKNMHKRECWSKNDLMNHFFDGFYFQLLFSFLHDSNKVKYVKYRYNDDSDKTYCLHQWLITPSGNTPQYKECQIRDCFWFNFWFHISLNLGLKHNTIKPYIKNFRQNIGIGCILAPHRLQPKGRNI